MASVSSKPALKAAYSAQIAKLTAETDRRVHAIEQRQIALAAALSNEQVDEATLRRLGFYPAKAGEAGEGGPFESVGNPTFKALFNSWKKLDQLQDEVIAIPSDKPIKTAVTFTSGFGVRADPLPPRCGDASGNRPCRRIRHPDLCDCGRNRAAERAGTAAATATWSNSTTAAVSSPATAICQRYSFMPAITSLAVSRLAAWARPAARPAITSTMRCASTAARWNPIPFMKSTDYVIAMQKRSNYGVDGPDRRKAARCGREVSLLRFGALPISIS